MADCIAVAESLLPILVGLRWNQIYQGDHALSEHCLYAWETQAADKVNRPRSSEPCDPGSGTQAIYFKGGLHNLAHAPGSH